MSDGERRWAEVEAAARQNGVDPPELSRLVLRPLSRGGAGWRWWRPDRTTPELAAWLMLRLEELAKERGAP